MIYLFLTFFLCFAYSFNYLLPEFCVVFNLNIPIKQRNDECDEVHLRESGCERFWNQGKRTNRDGNYCVRFSVYLYALYLYGGKFRESRSLRDEVTSARRVFVRAMKVV